MSDAVAVMQEAATDKAPFQVRIFPHNRVNEFLTEDALRAWLLNGLRGRGGRYLLVRTDAVQELPCGSIVLFRYGNKIIGEGVVSKKKEPLPVPVTEITETGMEQQYHAQVHFNPLSIRLYAPAVDVKEIVDKVKEMTGKDITVAQTYHNLDWSIYPFILSKVAKDGTFIS
jgi:hypothetical protein